ncbi:MAG: TSUP family transporter, partial [Bacteroidota bacterium]|nr:TSUP family transporter [Bacteroidota bacterium]
MSADLVILVPLFAVIAFFYSSVGLGGGSSYTAVLAIFGVSYLIIPTLSLTLNILVTIGATIQFARHGHLKWRILGPLLAASIPAAWIGGRLQLAEFWFQV